MNTAFDDRVQCAQRFHSSVTQALVTTDSPHLARWLAVLSQDRRFDLKDFERFVAEKLPGYQRPRFVRIVGGHMNVTGTFKHQKVEYRKQGFDPSAIDDALFALVDGAYVPLDAEMFAKIESGEIQIA